MRSQLIKAVISSAFVCGLATAQAAQLQANVPFDFRVGDVLMHAGTYRVDATDTLIRVYDVTNAHGVFRLALPSSRPPTGRRDSYMVFTQYSGEYNLTSIWDSGSTHGDIIAPTKRQRELEVASRAQKATQIPLLASR